MAAGLGAHGGRREQSGRWQARVGSLPEDAGLPLHLAMVLVLTQHHELPSPGWQVLDGQPVHRSNDAAGHPPDAHDAHAELSLHPGDCLRRWAPPLEVHDRILNGASGRNG
jgi:hypothetical protein